MESGRGERRLSTAEAAARLGVKPATLYAYVSRGLLGRERSADGRTSTFGPADEPPHGAAAAFEAATAMQFR